MQASSFTFSWQRSQAHSHTQPRVKTGRECAKKKKRRSGAETEREGERERESEVGGEGVRGICMFTCNVRTLVAMHGSLIGAGDVHPTYPPP
jgi:hypothetical protein